MSTGTHPLAQLLRADRRYPLEAYQFVRDALGYAQDQLEWGDEREAEARGAKTGRVERHLTGQQLCDAIRLYALEQYGLLARLVLKNWGITNTGDFGEIVYNLIAVGFMKKSPTDRREDFDDRYEFVEAFDAAFRITQAKTA